MDNRRTVHSLAILLSNFPHIRLVYVSPAGLEMPAEVKEIVATKYDNIEQVMVELVMIIAVMVLYLITRSYRHSFSD
jgi:aspartate carbamoyltransferase catalytic subunit